MMARMRDDRHTIAALLLVVQSGLALLAALGLFTFAKMSNATAIYAGPELVAFGGGFVLLLLALGIAKDWRIARIGVYIWETVTVLGTVFSIMTSEGRALNWTTALSGVVLPIATIYLVHRSKGAGLRTQLVTGLLALTGLIHLSLVPEHLSQPPNLGGWFALDAVALLVLAMAASRGARWWRAPTIALLLANVLAYQAVVLSGKESVDDIGIATKLIELVALALTAWPKTGRIRLVPAGATITMVVFSGSLAWAAELRPGSTAGHHHGFANLVAAAPPTEAQRAAANQLIDDTRTGIARFEDVQVALAEGYVPSTAPKAETVHYANPHYQQKGNTLDPVHPPTLVYANTPNGPRLLGAMYMMPKANLRPPDIGGTLAEWHTHDNLCFGLPPFTIYGMQSPFGTCPVGSINAPTPAMLHVWTVPNPSGPFGDLNPAFVARLTRGGV